MKIISIDGIGEVTLRKSAKAKRLILKLSAEGVPTVTVPTYVPYIVAHKFALKQKEWIRSNARSMRPSIITEGKRIGFDHIVTFLPTDKSEPRGRVTASSITVQVPSRMMRTHPAVQAEAKKCCVRALRKQGEVYLPKRIHELSLIHGHQYNNITVRAVKTRWGSCSSSKNINLSIWLMQLPQTLIEYVLCHELAHLKHQHHQASFWQEVERMIPDYKPRRKALKDYQPRLL
jgi:predicted metal-dependent hydrolase